MTKQPRALAARIQASDSTVEQRPSELATQLRTAVRIARTTGPMLRHRSAPVVAATRAGLGWTTRTVQAMPSSTSRSLAAGSLGLGAGLYIGGAPRILAAAGLAPAAVIGAATLLRSNETVMAPEAAR